MPRDADRYGGGSEDFAKFKLEIEADVINVPGVTDEERFQALRQRTRGDARGIVEQYIYEKDRAKALRGALDELEFNYGSKVGVSQQKLAKILNGKECHPDNSDHSCGN